MGAKKENLRRKRNEKKRESSVSSRISSIWKSGGSKEKKAKRKDKERRGSKIMSFLSSQNSDRMDAPSPSNDYSADPDSSRFQYGASKQDTQTVLYDEDGVDDDDDEYYDE